MRHGPANRRQRNRSSNGGRRNNSPQPQRTQVYDSNGPEVRIRGTAYQVAEKYLALAKDSYSAGDRIMAESYYQHAEHYIRIIGEFNGTFDASRMNRDSLDENFDAEGNIQESNSKETIAVRIVEKEDLSLPASILGSSQKSAHVQVSKEVEAVE